MTTFCREFCGDCVQCRKALDECHREDRAYEEAARLDKQNPGGDRTHIDPLRQAALDHKGRP